MANEKTKTLKVEEKSGGIPHLLEINGEKYIFDKATTYKKDNIIHDDKYIWKKFDEKEYKDNLSIVVGALAKKTTTKELLSEIIKDIDVRTLKRLATKIKKKNPIKKHKGCLGFKIGDAYVELFG